MYHQHRDGLVGLPTGGILRRVTLSTPATGRTVATLSEVGTGRVVAQLSSTVDRPAGRWPARGEASEPFDSGLWVTFTGAESAIAAWVDWTY